MDVTLSDEQRMLADAIGRFVEKDYPFETRRRIVAHCAEAVGAMDKLVQITIEHVRTRQQFGPPLGRFQALQHRKAVSAAKVIVGRGGRRVGEETL